MLWTLIYVFVFLTIGYFLWRWLSVPVDWTEPTTATVRSGKYDWESPSFTAEGPFFIKPWLQPGNTPTYQADGLESMEILFHTASSVGACRVEIQALEGTADERNKVLIYRPEARAFDLTGVKHQVQYVTKLTGLLPGTSYAYKVFFGVDEVFSSTFLTRVPRGEEFRAIIFGDMGSGSPWQKQIAYQMSLDAAGAKYTLHGDNGQFVVHKMPRGAHLVIATGDMVYHHGRYNEYLSRFFPVYQASVTSPETGASLLDRVMVMPVTGNHDMGKYDPEVLMSFSEYPDLMAYFALFSLPLNGFAGDHVLGENEKSKAGGQQVGTNLPPMTGDVQARQALLTAAGDRYPRMANYSYDYGNVHWLCLDANTYMDWTDEKMRAWVRQDLMSVPKGVWKVVVFHHPPFTSNRKHQREQGMRFLADIFEECGVSIVFCGHAHLYERTRPLKFKATHGISNASRNEAGYVSGSITMDPVYDGTVNKRPDGVIYVTTGGGGAKLDSLDIAAAPNKWQPFTAKFVADRHSFTLVDFTRDAIKVKQIDLNGVEVDSFEIQA